MTDAWNQEGTMPSRPGAGYSEDPRGGAGRRATEFRFQKTMPIWAATDAATPAPQTKYMLAGDPLCRIQTSPKTIPVMDPNPTKASLTPVLKERRPELLA